MNEKKRDVLIRSKPFSNAGFCNMRQNNCEQLFAESEKFDYMWCARHSVLFQPERYVSNQKTLVITG
jgi:hypothetical protein